MTMPRPRFMLPAAFLAGATVLLLASTFLPYWRMTLHAPQYPQGLTVEAYLDRLEGDVREVDGLNHYIGMRPLGEAAPLEKSASIMAVSVIAMLVLAAVFVHDRRALWLSLPALAFPLGFLVDLAWWLRAFGTNLDPKAPLSSAIEPFVPPVLGRGEVGQFATVATPGVGLWLAVAASLLIFGGLYLHRRAYKPLVEEARRKGRAGRRVVTAGLVLLVIASPGEAAEWTVGPEDGAGGLARALAVATPGETIRVRGGHYDGPLTIDRPLTLVGEGWPVVDGGGDGTVIRVTAPGVTLSGFLVRGSGASLDEENSGIAVEAPRARIVDNRLEDVLFGIYTRKASGSEILDNEITGKDLAPPRRGDAIRVWYSDGVTIAGNEVSRSRDVVLWYSSDLHLHDNVVRDGRYGLHFMYCDDATIRGNLLVGNSVGAFLMYSRRLDFTGNTVAGSRGPSGYGVGLKDMDDAVVRRNLFTGNRVAVFLDNSPREMRSHTTVTGNRLASNDHGVELMPNVRRALFEGNGFEGNVEQVAIAGQGGDPVGNTWRGNYWSDYRGFDADRNGRGDLAYRADRLFESLADRSPELRLFRYGPAATAIDLAARVMPLFRPVPKLEDPLPRMEAPVLAGVPALPLEEGSLLLPMGIILLTGAALLWIVLGGPERFARSANRAAREASSNPRRGDVAIEARDLRKSFGDTVALDGVTFSIGHGEAVALWGANGAGKTTLLRALLGLVPVDGTISVGGWSPVEDGREVRRQIGFVPQETAFEGGVGVAETLRFYAGLRRVDDARVEELVGDLGLVAHRNKRVQELSGGLRQRLALAIALLADPPVLLLDEPTANLDATARRDLVALLADLGASRTLIFTSHRFDEVLALADRLLWLDDGRLAHDDRPEALAEQFDTRIAIGEFGLPAEGHEHQTACGRLWPVVTGDRSPAAGRPFAAEQEIHHGKG